MKKIIRYLLLILGCLIIAFSYNLFILPNKFVTFGIDGLGAIIYYFNSITPAINILIINTIILLFSSLFTDINNINKYILPSILIPFFMFLTEYITNKINIVLPETILLIIISSVLIGIGYTIIYKQDFKACTYFLLEEVIGNITKVHSKIYSWVLDFILVIIELQLFNYEIAFYSLFIIIVSRYIVSRAIFNINDSKMFYVITNAEDEVKKFMINEMKCELTELDVKGGFTKEKRSIILSVISKQNYYRLREGIIRIDPNAFVAITDTYDVINRKEFK